MKHHLLDTINRVFGQPVEVQLLQSVEVLEGASRQHGVDGLLALRAELYWNMYRLYTYVGI